ncbi:hypothetical protein QTP88_010870 [Uroleucon formosanum]
MCEKASKCIQNLRDLKFLRPVVASFTNSNLDMEYVSYKFKKALPPVPRKSLAFCQEHAVRGFKVSKERVTIMTCANAAGTHKLLSLFMIFLIYLMKFQDLMTVIIMMTLLIGQQLIDDSSSNESMGTSKGPTSTEAFAASETDLEWFEKQVEYCPTQLLRV